MDLGRERSSRYSSGAVSRAALAVLVAAAGCNSSTGTTDPHGGGDLGISFGPPDDMARRGGDNGDLATPDLAPPAGGDHYVLDKLILPMTNRDFAIDLNGDGKPDNAFGNIIGTLATQNLDAQGAVDQQIASGATVELARLLTSDPQRMNDPAARAVLASGKPQANPDFSGHGQFTIDNKIAQSSFNGMLSNAQFDSESPVTTKSPVTVTLYLALFQGSPPIALVLHGAHVQFTAGTDANSGAPGLLDGRLQGSIKNSDVQNTIIPAIAMLLTQEIQANPNSAAARQLESIFDTGMCGNAKPNDGIIDPCELAQNAIIQAVLAPDVQIYDAQGNYAPNPQNTMKDSLSIAVAFTAVKASF